MFPRPPRHFRPAITGLYHRKGCQCNPDAFGADGAPRRAGVRVSAEGVRCLYCREMVSVSVEESAVDAIRVNPPRRRQEPVQNPNPGLTDRHLGGDELWRLFCELREKSQGDDPNAAWVEFQQFVAAEKRRGTPSPSHSPS